MFGCTNVGYNKIVCVCVCVCVCVVERERIQATVTEGRLVLEAHTHTKWNGMMLVIFYHHKNLRLKSPVKPELMATSE